MKKHKTNEEFMADMMAFSRHGALIQAFVIEGLAKYADMVIEAHEGGNLKTGMFINAEAWAGCAKEVKAKIDEHLER
jgi:hypothetical protein